MGFKCWFFGHTMQEKFINGYFCNCKINVCFYCGYEHEDKWRLLVCEKHRENNYFKFKPKNTNSKNIIDISKYKLNKIKNKIV